MKYYFKSENRINETEELLHKYGSFTPITALGMYELSEQPDYTPISYNEVSPGVYYPVQDYSEMQQTAVQALIAAGYSEVDAVAMLT